LSRVANERRRTCQFTQGISSAHAAGLMWRTKILIAKGMYPEAIQELLHDSSIQLTPDTYVHLFEQVQWRTADKWTRSIRAKVGAKA
jgi:hypothetical protein